MTRATLALWSAAAPFVVGLAVSTPAQAGPPPPCSFTLSPPHVVNVAGVDTVVATLAPAECGPPATPYVSIACIEALGVAPKLCSQGGGFEGAQASTPLRPGVTYESSGRGCPAWIGQSIAPDCELLGPIRTGF